MNARIAKIETFPLLYPTVGRFKFFEGPQGRPVGRPAVLVKITGDDGTIGWGQSVPAPRWSYETLETVHSTINRYLELVPKAGGAENLRESAEPRDFHIL
jgi:L-alanine-DL-glutamate epimerase-like enolase superfamily enzyme